jgi:hypothetical protein
MQRCAVQSEILSARNIFLYIKEETVSSVFIGIGLLVYMNTRSVD